MAERSKAAVLKTVIPSDRDRGFESHSLLHTTPQCILEDYPEVFATLIKK